MLKVVKLEHHFVYCSNLMSEEIEQYYLEGEHNTNQALIKIGFDTAVIGIENSRENWANCNVVVNREPVKCLNVYLFLIIYARGW